MPDKRHGGRSVAFLSRPEVEAVLDAPSKVTWIGRRDRVLLLVAIPTGLRVFELIQLRRQDVATGPGAHLRFRAKVARSGARRSVEMPTAASPLGFENAPALIRIPCSPRFKAGPSVVTPSSTSSLRTRNRGQGVPLPRQKADHTARPPSHRGHGPPAARGRPRHHRPGWGTSPWRPPRCIYMRT
jgi:integrase